ncbi:uncharacterized protein LOC127276837 isoform X2 [Leptopilina boulardi]|nr:uncharacterized protein LOC127276837 isoform X2 [Leptopilina boulardi]
MDLLNPIDTPVNKNVGEVLMMIIKYSLANSLTLTATANLFQLINCIFAKPILPESRYLIDKLFNPTSSTTYHALCTTCGKNIGTFSSSDIVKRCDICNIDVNVKDQMYNNFFVTLDPSDQIANLVEANSDYYSNVMNYERIEPDIFRNICDGKLYRRFLKRLHPIDRKRYLTATFNTDGAPLFESSTYSIWPIYIMLNELPFSVKTNNLIVVGLWFSKKKPEMNVFLEPFVTKMNELGDEGIPCTINNKEDRVKVFCLVCCVDSIARAPMLGLTQFNGKYGCPWCKNPGSWVENPNKENCGSHKYTWINPVGLLRTEEETLQHVQECTEEKPIYGFKNPSELLNLNKFDIIDGFVPDPMHILSGLGKQFAHVWFGVKLGTSSVLTMSEIEEINRILNSIKVPHQVGRLTRSLVDKEHWKAREWENWILYYSAPIMSLYLDKKLVDHWVKLVEAIHLLLGSKITLLEINRANQLLHEFVYDTECLYSPYAMTFNIHLLLHLARSVLNWGPLYEHSTFAFEAGNAKLLNSVHAAKGVHKQICRYITLNSSYRVLEIRVDPFASSEVKNFCTQLSKLMIKTTEKLSTVRYFGKSSRVPSDLIDELRLSNVARSFQKITKDGCLYLTSLKKNKRSDNSFAILKDGTYVKIRSFIVDRELEVQYAIVHQVVTHNSFRNKCKMIQKIVAVNVNKIAINTCDIDKICVHAQVGDQVEYIIALPNLCSY